MRTPILIAIVIAVLLAIGGAAFLLLRKEAPQEPEEIVPVTFPVEQVTELGVSDTVTLRLANGSSVQVPQFLSEEQSETASEENGLDVSFGESELYQILYFPEESYFLVSILDEPLKDARFAAEAELRAKLKLQDPALCALTLDVFVASDVSEIYSGRDLGLSFCSGAVQLP